MCIRWFFNIVELNARCDNKKNYYTYYTVSLKVTYMCMICRVCVLRTDRKLFRHLRDGGTDKHLTLILSKFSRYCSLFHCQLNFTSYIISDRVISSASLLPLALEIT
jgi:hypothetical protein